MRIEKWDWTKANKMVAKNGQDRARKAAKVLAAGVRSVCPVGTTNHPIFRTGPNAGKPWTKRDGGSLKRSIRVVERNSEKNGFDLSTLTSFKNFHGLRIYIGNYYAYYARIVEFHKPFFRPKIAQMQAQISSILKNG